MGTCGADGGTSGNHGSVRCDIWRPCVKQPYAPLHSHSYSCKPTPARPTQTLAPGLLGRRTPDIVHKRFFFVIVLAYILAFCKYA